MNEDRLPLGGTRVLAVEQAVAGPLCTRHLGELGAEVIKIERPGAGDFARRYDSLVRGQSAHFVWLNHGKQSVALDLRSPEGNEVFAAMLARSDILVSNLAPGAIDRIVPPARLTEINPMLVHCVISGYGTGGPFGERRAYDLIVQGEAGVTANTGTPQQPAKPGVSLADLSAGTYAVAAVLAALRTRDATGRGDRVEIALLDSVVEWMMPLLLAERHGGAPPPAGVHHQSIAPYGPFPTRDGHVINIAVQNDGQWERLCSDVLQSPALRNDDALGSNEVRLARRTEVVAAVGELTGRLALEELTDRLEAAGVPWGRLNELGEVLVHPQLEARDRWRDVLLPDGSPAQVVASPLSGLAASHERRVPARGEHSRAVLRSLGMDDDRIDELVDAGVVEVAEDPRDGPS